MSVQWLSWVLSQEMTTKGTDRLVLLSLANHANDLGQAWPSIGLIAREANAAERAVQRSLANLRKLKLVSVEYRGAPDKRIPADRRPNLFYIHRGATGDTSRGDAGDTPDPLRGDAGGTDGVTLVTERGATGSTQTVIEPNTEPSAEKFCGRDTRLSPETVDLGKEHLKALRERSAS